MLVLAASTALSSFLSYLETALAADRANAAWSSVDTQLDAAATALGTRLTATAEPARTLAAELAPVLASEPDPQERAIAAARALCSAVRGTWAPEAAACEGTAEGGAADRVELGVWLIPDGGAPFARRMRRGPAGPELLGDDADLSLRPDSLAYQEALVRPEGWASFPATATEPWTAQYTVPLYDTAGIAIGAVHSRIGWEDLTALVRTLELGRTGYAFVLSRTGELIGHPRVEPTAEGMSIARYAIDPRDPELARAGELARRGERGFLNHQNPSSGEPERISWRPLADAAWSVMAVSSHREVVGESLQERRLEFGRTFSHMLVAYAAFAAAIALLQPSFATTAWCHSLAWSAVTVVATTSLWKVGSVEDPELAGNVRIFDQAALTQYLRAQEEKLFGESIDHEQALRRIPTGVFLQSLEFESANNARVTGIVWQRLPLALPEGAAGVIFPEAVEADVREIYTRDIEEHGGKVGVLKGWSFVLTVRERFDFARYPFDTKDVWLRMWPMQFDASVVLVPDLESYATMAPGDQPGLDSDFVSAGWNPVGTFFQYREQSYSTDFGNRLYTGRQGFPELNYTLSVRRAFMSTFVSDLIPLLVVAGLLFGVLRTVTANLDAAGRTGFDFTNVLGACSGVAFVVVLGHIQLRTALGGQPTTYLECYYFVMYGMLLMVGINAWHTVTPDGPAYVRWEDNLLARLAFWPTITTAIMLATLVYFYPSQDESSGAARAQAPIADPAPAE